MNKAERYKSIVDEYGNGASLRELASKYSLSHEGVRQILKRQGVKIRPHGTNRYLKIKGHRR